MAAAVSASVVDGVRSSGWWWPWASWRNWAANSTSTRPPGPVLTSCPARGPEPRPDPGADGDFLDDLSPDSIETVSDAKLEPSLAGLEVGERVQFERLGYFSVDPDSTPERPVFNRTVTLRDTWAKVKARG